MTNKYILNAEGQPEQCHDLLAWAHWFEKADRHVAHDTVGDVKVSTVFMGLDHSFGMQGGPILYETMVFGGPLDGGQDRYSTRAEAEVGHAAILERVKTAAGPASEPPQ